MDDELLQEFIAETREHLGTIEADLLTIEENGDHVDQELINKVFRAAHSIKGGSGFFGLEKIKELSHRAETVLDMMRAGKMMPNPEITNLLLSAFDQLREMSNDPAGSEHMDIADLLIALNDLASSYLDPQGKASLNQTAVLTGTDNTVSVSLPQTDVERASRTGQTIYRVRYDLIQDIEARDIHLLKLFNSLCAQGEILDCAVDFAAVGSLDDEVGTHLPLTMVYATTAAPPQAAEIMLVAVERLEILEQPEKPLAATPASFEAPPIVPPPPAAAAIPVPAMVEPVAAATGQNISEAAAAPQKKSSDNAAKKKAPTTEETLRVNVSLLENLMNLAGELVLGRNQLRAAIAQDNAQALSHADQHLNQVTSELQDAIMQTRLQPIGNVFGKFPRVVRDMSAALGKEIQVVISGKEVELDRSLLEGLSDPLTHMIRNAADHGLETPDERRAAGKSSEGTLTISASHEAGHVVIQIVDDGRGIDPEKIAASAVKKGQISSEKLAGMSAQEKLELIMMPGFSTAEKVSEFSGRGVGMDVVRTNINKLGGQVEISSIVGVGTTFRIKLPLTLAIIPSLIVSLGPERFAIPQINVAELLRIRAEDVKRRIEVVGGAEVLLLRDTTLPLVRFEDYLGLVPTYVDPASGRTEVDRRTSLADRRSPHHPGIHATAPVEKGETVDQDRSDGRRHRADSALEIAVINSGAVRYGLVVSGFHDTEEIVVKPLGRHVKHLTEYAGATILGDGAVALIIDAAGLADKAELASVSASARALELKAEAERRRLEDIHSLLMFYNGPGDLCAVFLEHVERIERISRDRLETHGGRRTMQYRGASLPLVTLSDTASVEPISEEQELVVLVARVGEREVGLLGAMPVDVIESTAAIDVATHRQPGVTGSAVIGDDTIMLVDIHEMVHTAWPDWSRSKTKSSQRVEQNPTPAVDTLPATTPVVPNLASGPAILLAEDSDFFRAQVKKYIEEGGFRVYAGADGEAAWALLVQHLDDIALVVTDIEMPRLNGLELTQRIRADQRTAHLPVIAVSSLAGEDDRARGAAAGVTEYQVKLDREALLEGILQLLN